jgi:magnesium transporter
MLRRTIERLLRHGATQPLARVLEKTRSADLAFLLGHFNPAERVQLLQGCVDDARRAKVLAATDSDVAAAVLELLPLEQAGSLLGQFEPDDASDVLQHMPQEVAEQLLRRLEGAERSEVEDLTRYESSTAGGIMSPRFLALSRDTTAKDAIEHLRRVSAEIEMVFYVYVVNEIEQLLGVVSLRNLVTTKEETTLFELMSSDVVSVTPDEDQEEVAKIASRYGLLAVPVVDQSNKLIGIVTVDDVLDVLREEATEDILRMAGAGVELAPSRSLARLIGQRAPWLLVAAVGGGIGAPLLLRYEQLAAFPLLVLCVPLVMGLSGVTALQAATVMAQRISQGQLVGRWGGQWLRQAAAGALLGLVYGALSALICWLLMSQLPAAGAVAPRLPVAVGIGLLASMTQAAAVGALLPALFARMRFDPALATGPLGAIGVELLALVAFFSVGQRVL